MRRILFLVPVFFVLFLTNASAAILPDVENVTIDGDIISWDEQEGATGYNIILGYSYYDTVRGSLSYRVTEPGDYRVVAFNDNGDFSSDYSPNIVTYAPGEGEGSGSISYTYHYRVLFVYKTCQDVGPGESCLARCPNSYEHQYGTVYPTYMSGGACSTSDIVEADAFLSGPRTYKCTVPTFSGEVVAQAICPINR